MKTYFQLETKCSGWSCQEEKFQLSPFIVVCYSWTVEYNWDKFTKRLRLLAGLLMLWWAPSGGAPSAVACQDNLLILLFSRWHLPFQLLPVACVTWQSSSSSQEPLCSTFLDLGALIIQRGACSGCLFSGGCPVWAWAVVYSPWQHLPQLCWVLLPKNVQHWRVSARGSVVVKADFWLGGMFNSRNSQFPRVYQSRGICKLDNPQANLAVPLIFQCLVNVSQTLKNFHLPNPRKREIKHPYLY